MAQYVLVYSGGTFEATQDEQDDYLQLWGEWFAALGEAVVDFGAPFAQQKTVDANGNVLDGGASALTGYSIVTAESVEAAAELAKGSPVLTRGGTVEVYEAVSMA